MRYQNSVEYFDYLHWFCMWMYYAKGIWVAHWHALKSDDEWRCALSYLPCSTHTLVLFFNQFTNHSPWNNLLIKCLLLKKIQPLSLKNTLLRTSTLAGTLLTPMWSTISISKTMIAFSLLPGLDRRNLANDDSQPIAQQANNLRSKPTTREHGSHRIQKEAQFQLKFGKCAWWIHRNMNFILASNIWKASLIYCILN